MSNEDHLHPQIRDTLELYLRQVNEALPGWLEGFYVYGSVALGEYSLRLSDIDFVAVTRERPIPSEIAVLNRIHRRVEAACRKPNMNGIYVTWGDLGKLSGEVAPFPYYVDGRMHDAGYFELNLVTWYELKHCGFRLLGPEPEKMNYEVDWDMLISKMHANLNSYWRGWMRRAAKTTSFYSLLLYFRRTTIEWGVLGITRLYYTFRENQITTKARAGDYALTVVPKEWHPILRESIGARRGQPSLYRWSMRQRKRDALNYMAYITDECNRMLQQQ